MAKQLQTGSIAAPGFFGLNTQDSSIGLPKGYALQAKNCVIDKSGRLGARRGWLYRTEFKDGVEDDNVGVDLKGMHKFLDLGSLTTTISWNDTSFFKGVNDLVTLTPTTSDTISSGDWRAATLNDRAYFFQEGYDPLYYTNETTTGEFKSIPNHSGYTGTVPKAGIVMSAFGRLWATNTSGNKTTIWFSDLLDGAAWGSGSAGSIDITGTFAKDSDVVTGLGSHNGMLIVFCKNSIVIFKDNDYFNANFDPTTMQLVETISGIGCVATDSIVNTGEDILFLSASGLRSLGRTIQEKSQPMRDISKNIRDDLIDDIESLADINEIHAVYAPKYAFYLLAIPSRNKVYCFDTRVPLQDGSYRVTTWSDFSFPHYTYDNVEDELLMVSVDGIAQYFGFQDNGEDYRMVYYTNYFDLETPVTHKVLKKLAVTLIGSKGQDFIMKTATDYGTVYRSYPFVLRTGMAYYYNEGEYGIAEYSGGLQIENVKSPIGGAGEVLQIGFEADIVGAPLSLQKIDIFIKTGRMI